MADDGIEFLIGGDPGPLAKALAEAEKAIQASGQRSQNIVKRLVEKENQIYKSALDNRIRELEEEGERNHQLILEQVKDRKKAEELMLANARQIEEQITRLRKGERDKRIAAIQADLKREADAEAKAAKAAADAREKAEHEANERIKQGRQAIATGAAAAFAGLALGVGTSLKAFTEFEATLNQMAAVSNLTAKEFEQVKAVALAMGAQTKFSAVEAAQGMSELAKAGFTAEQAMTAIPGVLSLAAAAGTSVAEAAATAGGALQGFGLAADQAGRVADILAKAANVSSVDVKDLAGSFQNVVPLAKAAGLTIEDVTTALAVMGDNMIKSGEAGTSLKAALAVLLNPSKEAQNALHKLGLSIQDTHGKMLPLSDIVDQLRTKTEDLTDVQKASTIANIFGNDAVAGMLALMNKAPDAYNRTALAINNATGAAEEMAATMNRGLGGSFEQLEGSVSTILILMGDQFAPLVKTTAEALTALANAVGSVDQRTQTVVAGLGAVALAFTGLTAAAGALGLALPVLEAGLVALGVAGGPVVWTIGALSLGLGALTVATKAQADADRNAAVAAQEERKARHDAAASALDHKRALEQLVREHDQLTAKASLSKQEQAQLHAIEKKLKEQYPELAAAVAKAGDSHWGNVPAINAERDAIMELVRARIMDARLAARASQKKYDDSVSAYDRAARAANASAGNPGFGPHGIGRVRTATDAIAEQAALEARGAAGKQAIADQQALREMEGLLKVPKPSTGGGRPRGAGYGAVGGRGRGGGKSGAESAADKAVEQIEKRYSRLISESKAAGEAEFKQVELLAKMADELVAKKLTRFEKGNEAVAKARQEIKNYYTAESVAIKKATDEAVADQGKKQAAMEAANNAITLEGQRVADEEMRLIKEAVAENNKAEATKVQAVENANNLIIQAGEEMSDDLIDQNRKTMRQLVGDLTALFIDPSSERFANFAKSLIQDEERLKQIGKIASDVANSFNDAKSASAGFGAALGTLGKSLDPFTLALAGLSVLISDIQYGMKLVADNAERLKDAVVEAAMAEAEASGNPGRIFAAQMMQLDAEEEAAVAPQREEFGRTHGWGLTPEDRAKAEEEFEKRIIDIRRTYRARRTTLEREWAAQATATFSETQEKQADAETKANDDAEERAEKHADVMGEIRDEMSEAVDGIVDAYERQAEARKELAEGGRDDWGKKISLEAEVENQRAEQRLNHEKKLKDLQAERLKIQGDIKQLAEDEAKAIQGILDEGIAVRAKTEFEDKTERINGVKADYATRRTDLMAREVEINVQIAEQTTEHEKALSRIGILGGERIAALQDEIGKQDVIIEQNTQILGQRAAELGMMQAMAAMGISVTGRSARVTTSSGGSSGGTFGSGTGNKDLTGRINPATGKKYHSGGIVTGSRGAEVPAVLKVGEEVLTESNPRHAYNVGAWRPYAQPISSASGGGMNMGGVHMVINPAPGMDERQFARKVRGEFESWARRAGWGR